MSLLIKSFSCIPNTVFIVNTAPNSAKLTFSVFNKGCMLTSFHRAYKDLRIYLLSWLHSKLVDWYFSPQSRIFPYVRAASIVNGYLFKDT